MAGDETIWSRGEVCWKGVGAGDLYMLMLFWWQTRAELQAMLDVAEVYVSRWKMKFSSTKTVS